MALAELYGKRRTPCACSENGYFFHCELLFRFVNTCAALVLDLHRHDKTITSPRRQSPEHSQPSRRDA